MSQLREIHMNSYPQKPVVARPKNVSQGGCSVNRLLGLLLILIWTTGLGFAAAAPNWSADSTSLVSESCSPANNQVDPGETVSVSFTVKNTAGSGTVNDVHVQLLEGSGVEFVQEGLAS